MKFRYLLLLWDDACRPNVATLREYETMEAREMGTLREMGIEDQPDSDWAKNSLKVLRRGEELDFEGDESIRWLDALGIPDVIDWRPLTEKPPSLKTVLLSFADGVVDSGEWDEEEQMWQWGVDEFKAAEDGGTEILAWAEMPKGVAEIERLQRAAATCACGSGAYGDPCPVHDPLPSENDQCPRAGT